MAHGKIMTDLERWRWHVSPNALCGGCQCEDEGILHDIRYWESAKEFWNSILPTGLASEFYLLQLWEWVLWLLRLGSGEDNLHYGRRERF